MATGKPWTGDDIHHNHECHQRWIQRSNRSTGNPDYREEWYFAQCGGCRFWIALQGKLGRDYGVCTNPASHFDGQVRFEHDGCTAYDDREDDSFG